PAELARAPGPPLRRAPLRARGARDAREGAALAPPREALAGRAPGAAPPARGLRRAAVAQGGVVLGARRGQTVARGAPGTRAPPRGAQGDALADEPPHAPPVRGPELHGVLDREPGAVPDARA